MIKGQTVLRLSKHRTSDLLYYLDLWYLLIGAARDFNDQALYIADGLNL